MKNETPLKVDNQEVPAPNNQEKQEKENKNTYSEIIVKEIIEKMISLTITDIRVKEVESKIGEHCFDFIKKSLFPYLTQGFFCYETDNNQLEDRLFFCTQEADILNTWVEIPEPGVQVVDRDAGSMIKFVGVDNVPDENVEIANNEVNSSCISKNIVTNQNEKSNESSIIRKKYSKKITKKKEPPSDDSKVIMPKRRKKKGKEDDDEIDEKDLPIIDLPSYDLDPKKYRNKYIERNSSEEVEKLRQEREEMEKEREEERRKEEEKARIEKAARDAKLAKPFDSQKFTFDSEGNVISKKSPGFNFLAREFWWSRPSVRDGGIKPSIPENTSPKKRIRNSLAGSIGDRNKISKAIQDLSDRDIKEGVSKSRRHSSVAKRLSLKEAKLAEPRREVKEKPKPQVEEVIYNRDPTEMYEKKFSKFQQRKEVIAPYTPSGEVFNIFQPEVGVVLKSSDNNVKDGGMEYSMKYNKPSMEEFSRLALDSSEYNSRRYLSSSGQVEKPSYVGYAHQFSAENNPLINSGRTLVQSVGRNDLIPKSSMNSMKTNKYLSQFSKLSNELQLTTDLDTIRNIFYDEDEHKPRRGSLKNHDIDFYKHNNYKKKIKGLKLDYIDKFNSNIIQDENWGSEMGSSKPRTLENKEYFKFSKPDRRTHIREVGFRIAHTKMPRDRLLYSVQSLK